MGKRSSGERREPAPGSRASETGRRATAARAVAAAAAGKVDLSSGGDAVIGAAEERLGWRDVVTATAEAREGRAARAGAGFVSGHAASTHGDGADGGSDVSAGGRSRAGRRRDGELAQR